MDWKPLHADWRMFYPSAAPLGALPAAVQMPPTPWRYAAATQILTVAAPSLLRLGLHARGGPVSVALVSEDFSELRSISHTVAPCEDLAVIELRFLPRKGPAHLVVRSIDPTEASEVVIDSLEIAEDADAVALPAAPLETPVAPPPAVGRYDVVRAIKAQAPQIGTLRPYLAKALQEMDVGGVFSLPQGLVLAAAARDFQPDVIIDLGTGRGGSAVALAAAAPGAVVYTLDNEPQWQDRIELVLAEPPPNVRPIVADITTFDFTEIVVPAKRVMIFLDAHGFEVAARFFAHILPLAADKPHLVFLHDIDDLRPAGDSDESGSYGGKRMWRGTDDYFRNMETTSAVRIGWMCTAMEQAIALMDFAGRNRLTVETVDDRLHIAAANDKAAALAAIGAAGPVALTYFTMNETRLRHFPAG